MGQFDQFYEYTPAITVDGDLAIASDDTYELLAGQPMAEAVKNTIATEAGSYAPDPENGVAMPTKNRSTAAADLDTAIRTQLQPYVRQGLIKNTSVTVERDKNALKLSLQFVDTRDQRKVGITRNL